MSKITMDGIEYEADPHIAALLQVVSEERDDLRAHAEAAKAQLEVYRLDMPTEAFKAIGDALWA